MIRGLDAPLPDCGLAGAKSRQWTGTKQAKRVDCPWTLDSRALYRRPLQVVRGVRGGEVRVKVWAAEVA